MAAFRTYRHDFTLFKPFSLADDRRVPAATWIVRAYRRGGNSTQTKTIGLGGGDVLSMRDIGDIQVNDVVQIGTDASATRNVSAIQPSGITFGSGGTGTFSVQAGNRIIPTNLRPKTFVYANQGSAETAVASQVTMDGNGEGHFYTLQAIIDCIATDGANNFALIEDQTGQGVSFESPYQWNATGDGSTNDAVAFQSLINRAVADGVQRISIPPGTYQINSTITIPALSGIVLAASAPGQVVISFGHLAGAGFDLTGACSDIGFEDIFFSTTTANTSIIQTSTTTSRFSARRCTFLVSTNRTGIIEQGSDARIVDCVFSGLAPGTWIRLNGSQRAQIQGCFGTWSGNPSGRVIDIDTGCRGIRLMNCDFRGNVTGNSAAAGVVGLRNSGVATPPRDTILIGCHLAGGTAGRGVDIDAAQGFQAIGCTIEDSLVGYSIDGGSSIKIMGGLCVGMQNESVDINGGSHIRIVELESSDVSQVGAGTKDHINIAANLNDISVMGLTAGNFIRGSGITARSAVRVEAGTSNKIQILGVRSVASDFASVIYNNQSTSKEIDIGHNIEAGTNVTYAHTAMPAGINVQTGLIVGVLTLSDATTTPNVQNVHTIIHAPSGNITYTALNNGTEGQRVVIINTHATNTIDLVDGATFKMAGNMTLAQFDSITFVLTGSTWIETGRSNN